METEKDYRIVENIARETFWNLNFPGCYEHYFVHVMKEHKNFIPELDYVIEVDGMVIGYIMYAKSRLVDENGNVKPIVTMEPLCILPEFQRMGYGKALLEYTFEVVKSLRYDVIINLGNPCNYIPRGYKSCKKYNVCLEGNIFPALKVLDDEALDDSLLLKRCGEALRR